MGFMNGSVNKTIMYVIKPQIDLLNIFSRNESSPKLPKYSKKVSAIIDKKIKEKIEGFSMHFFVKKKDIKKNINVNSNPPQEKSP